MSSEPTSPSNNLLIQSSGLAPIAESTSPVLSEIIKRSLVHIQTSKTLGRLHRIGEYELQWPDYQFVCLWADHLNMPPVGVFKILLDHNTSQTHTLETKIVNGRFIDLVADERLAGIKSLPAIEGLRIEKFNVLRLDLCVLDLSSLPNLTSLDCSGNQLTVLDLSPVPNLTELLCAGNKLTELDLSSVPNLAKLWCAENKLTELDLSLVPNLTELWCHGNKLTNLDLSSVPNLTKLWCQGNKLTSLSLSSVPNLTELWCYENKLTELDLSSVPNLMELWCADNKLTELDLSSVPNLTKLWCHENKLSELDIRPLKQLKDLFYYFARLVQRPDQNFKNQNFK